MYTTTSPTFKRKKDFLTPIGVFSYRYVPVDNFYLGVRLVENKDSSYFLADPFRALADIFYQRRTSWQNAASLSEDLRIETEDIKHHDLSTLKALLQHYPSKRVRKTLTQLYEDLD